jgi:coenzyme F420-reducing hydrogenase alpha subunit
MAKVKIDVDHLARIEGHGDIHLEVEGGKLKRCEFAVTEPARLFESMVRGRMYDEVPYVASRVCGICSASHTLTNIDAVEQVFGVEVTPRTRALRELLVYGSYLQNHATHLFVFAAPDFLGHKSVFPLEQQNAQLFNSALELKALGNELCAKVGGRSIHPITAVVGGFTHEPEAAEYLELAAKMRAMLPFALSVVDLFCDFGATPLETDGEFLAMVAPGRYPVVGAHTARLVRAGVEFASDAFGEHIEEYAVDRSAAFLARVKPGGGPYMASALARINASWDFLSDDARFAAAKAGLRPPEYNPLANNIAQAVEIVDALVRCSALCESLAGRTTDAVRAAASAGVLDAAALEQSVAPVAFEVRAGEAVGFTEAPRGALFHQLELDEQGRVVKASILTPTSQNIANIEADMQKLVQALLDAGAGEAELQLEVEKLVRAYDPCLSCSVH